MKNTLIWLRDYGILFLTFLLLVSSVQTCNTKNQMASNTKFIYDNTRKIDSLTIVLGGVYVLSKRELQLMMDIENLQGAKMTLYDWNAIVRTVVRPDDRMNEYDKQITKLQKELDDLRVIKTQKGK